MGLKWSQPKVVLSVVLDGADGGKSSAVVSAIKRCAQRWNAHSAATGAPRLLVTPLAQPVGRAVQDGVNAVLLRSAAWCPGSESPGDDDCYDRERQAITHLYLSRGVSPIVEADVEINGVDARWLTPQRAVDEQALDALLMHELGHLLGLDHACGLQLTRGVEAGERSQRCDTTAARASTMYPDPLEPGRAQSLEPSSDALEQLQNRYGGPDRTGVFSFPWALALTLSFLGALVAGVALWRRSLLRTT